MPQKIKNLKRERAKIKAKDRKIRRKRKESSKKRKPISPTDIQPKEIKKSTFCRSAFKTFDLANNNIGSTSKTSVLKNEKPTGFSKGAWKPNAENPEV